MISKMRERVKNKKGFTLVELIVVLVILAILIALLVPALTGYIDKAKQRGVETEARNALVAAQTEVSELYRDVAAGTFAEDLSDTDLIDRIQALAEVDGEISNITASNEGKILTLTYVNDGYTATYTHTPATDSADATTEWEVGPTPAP